MKLNKNIAAALNIKEGEEISIFLLMLISFFMGTAIAFFYTASTSLFLGVFETRMLPYAYVASGLLGYFIWLLSSKVSKKLSLPNMLMTYMLFLTISVLFISIGVHVGNVKWLPFLMFAWVRVFTYINAIVFWTLAGRVFDLRQGKRLFGLIGAGEVISTIIGFFSIPVLLKYIKVIDLITISLVGLILCVITLFITIKKFKRNLIGSSVHKKAKATKKEITIKEVFASNYLRNMFILAILPMFALIFVDYIFLAQTKVEYPDKNFIAGFLGVFFGLAAIAEFFIKVLLSGKLISKYGIKLGLAALPCLLLASTFLASASGTLIGTVGIFYSFIAFTKFSERVLRSSLNDPSYQILYLPLPEYLRLEFQSKVEGIPKAMGSIFGGLALIIFAYLSFLNIVHYNLIFLIILILWVKISFTMYNEYRKSLKTVLVKKEKKEYKKLEEESELSVLFHETASTSPQFTNNIFDLFEKLNPIKSEAILLQLLMQSNENVNKNVLKLLEDRKMIACLPVLEYCLNDETLAEIHEQIKDTITKIQEYKNTALKVISYLAQSNNIDDKVQATVLAGYSPRYEAIKLVSDLLKSKIPEVKRAAILSAGRLKRIELKNDLMENLFDAEYSNYSYSAIKNIGSSFLDELELYFNRMGANKKNLPRIISLFSIIGGKKALELLRKKINYPDKDIRELIFIALHKMGYNASSTEIPLIKNVIEEEITLMVWIMAAQLDISEVKGAELLKSALEQEIKAKKDYVFILLSIIYESATLQLVRENMQTGTLQSKAFALEIIDLLVSEDIKEMLLPLLEDIPAEECVQGFKEKFPQEKLNYHERLIEIINKDFSRINRWTKACALKELIAFSEKKTLDILTAFCDHSDPLLMDTAIRTVYEADKGLVVKIAKDLNISKNQIYVDLLENKSSVWNKVMKLKGSPMFKTVSEYKLVELAIDSVEIADSANFKNGSSGTMQLKINMNTLLNLMSDDIEIARSVVSFLTAQTKFELKEFA